MGELTDRIKANKVQPEECSCLPSFTKAMLQMLIAEKIAERHAELLNWQEVQDKFPIMTVEASEILRKKPEYQQGLVTAGSLKAKFAPEYLEELRDSIGAHEFLADMILNIPECKVRQGG